MRKAEKAQPYYERLNFELETIIKMKVPRLLPHRIGLHQME